MSDPEPGWCYHCGRSYRKAQIEHLPCETTIRYIYGVSTAPERIVSRKWSTHRWQPYTLEELKKRFPLINESALQSARKLPELYWQI